MQYDAPVPEAILASTRPESSDSRATPTGSLIVVPVESVGVSTAGAGGLTVSKVDAMDADVAVEALKMRSQRYVL